MNELCSVILFWKKIGIIFSYNSVLRKADENLKHTVVGEIKVNVSGLFMLTMLFSQT